MPITQRITTSLWFDNNAEEAVNHYTSIFKNSKVLSITRNGEGWPGQKGSALALSFELDGQEFGAINGGPAFKFTEATSLMVNCETQEEVDYYWEKLLASGKESQCGWLKDKFGLSWQITPTVLLEMLRDKDPAKAKRVLDAMMKMVKIDIKTLQQAYDGVQK